LEIDDAEYVSIVQDELSYGGYSKEIVDIGTEALFHYGNKLNEKVIQRMLKDYLVGLRKDKLINRREELKKKQLSCTTQDEVNAVLKEIYDVTVEISNLAK
jgi:hypothetical protein